METENGYTSGASIMSSRASNFDHMESIDNNVHFHPHVGGTSEMHVLMWMLSCTSIPFQAVKGCRGWTRKIEMWCCSC